MRVLGIETSCDETSAAVVEGNRVLSNVIASQAVHLQFGGVVPELASRAHLRKIVPIVEEALHRAGAGWEAIDAIAVTYGPGLIGALLVGLNYAKGLSLVLDKPFVGVNHLEGHIYSNFLSHPELVPPFLALLVSGGHTLLILVEDHLSYRLLGQTRDDAIGEAYDKVAKMMGLGYPGGPIIDQKARQGHADYVTFPKGLAQDESFDFSYSGLKTAVSNFLKSIAAEEQSRHINDICASFQKAAVDVLVAKTIRAARTFQVPRITVAGGVAANSYLREEMARQAKAFHLQLFVPEFQYCTDNAAMIARAGWQRLKAGFRSELSLNAFATLPLGEPVLPHAG